MHTFVNTLPSQQTLPRAGFPLVPGKRVLFPLIKCPVFSVAHQGSGVPLLRSVSGREGALVLYDTE